MNVSAEAEWNEISTFFETNVKSYYHIIKTISQEIDLFVKFESFFLRLRLHAINLKPLYFNYLHLVQFLSIKTNL